MSPVHRIFHTPVSKGHVKVLYTFHSVPILASKSLSLAINSIPLFRIRIKIVELLGMPSEGGGQPRRRVFVDAPFDSFRGLHSARVVGGGRSGRAAVQFVVADFENAPLSLDDGFASLLVVRCRSLLLHNVRLGSEVSLDQFHRSTQALFCWKYELHRER